jgi:hypothetical protein
MLCHWQTWQHAIYKGGNEYHYIKVKYKLCFFLKNTLIDDWCGVFGSAVFLSILFLLLVDQSLPAA